MKKKSFKVVILRKKKLKLGFIEEFKKSEVLNSSKNEIYEVNSLYLSEILKVQKRRCQINWFWSGAFKWKWKKKKIYHSHVFFKKI